MAHLLDTSNPIKELPRMLIMDPEKQALTMIDEVISAYLSPGPIP
jgi:hypothetical protein